MTEVQDLRQREQPLETQLSGLRAAEMQEFADDETAGDSAMTELRRQIELIDDEVTRDHGGGLTGKGRRIMRWLRK